MTARTIARLVAETCRAQGVPEKVSDNAALAKCAVLLDVEIDHTKKKTTPRLAA